MKTNQVRKTISLSKHLLVTRKQLEDAGVFDATLGVDTKLFVDPKLIVNSKIEEFKNSRQKILDYFKNIIKIHRQSHITSRLRNEARDMLAIPEPKGLSIGYGDKTDRGTAIPKTLANQLLLSLSEILAVGIEDAEVMELLGLFVQNFASDRLSDLTVGIIYQDFCAYTQKISKDLKIKTKKFKINSVEYNLPVHPFLGTQIIFIPNNFLRVLPVATDWDEIGYASEHNKILRKEFNQILFPVLKNTIRDMSGKSKEEIDNFREGMKKLIDVYQKITVDPYDLQQDSKGYYSIQPFVDSETSNIKPQKQPKNENDLIVSIRELVTQFQRCIEQNGGNKLLYRKSNTGALQKENPHNEDVSQILFFLVADIFCQQANILLARESDAGRGPVDFSLGTGYDKKILVEIKKSNNKNLITGFQKQITAYQKSENAMHSFYVVIKIKKEISNKKKISTQLEQLEKLHEENKKKGIISPELFIIDGLIHSSPSKLK